MGRPKVTNQYAAIDSLVSSPESPHISRRMSGYPVAEKLTECKVAPRSAMLTTVSVLTEVCRYVEVVVFFGEPDDGDWWFDKNFVDDLETIYEATLFVFIKSGDSRFAVTTGVNEQPCQMDESELISFISSNLRCKRWLAWYWCSELEHYQYILSAIGSSMWISRGLGSGNDALTTYPPMDPQPSAEDILTLHKGSVYSPRQHDERERAVVESQIEMLVYDVLSRGCNTGRCYRCERMVRCLTPRGYTTTMERKGEYPILDVLSRGEDG